MESSKGGKVLPAKWSPKGFPTCMLCGETGCGAYLECESRNTWVHVLCAMFIPETVVVSAFTVCQRLPGPTLLMLVLVPCLSAGV